MRYLLLAIAFATSLTSLAQETYEISFDDVSLEDAVKEVAEKYQLKFSYDPRLLRQYRISKTIKVNREKKLLEALLAEVPIHFKKANHFILLIPTSSNQDKIVGKVYDGGTGQVLSYAQVTTAEQSNINDGTGAFSLRQPRDSMQITVTHLGYKPSTFWVKPQVDNVKIKLVPDVKVLPEFIFSDNSSDGTRGKYSSYFSINPKQIKYLPTVGEPDVFRSIQLLPGISASDDSNAGLVVRGSDPAQNHVILDGFTLYHLNHLFGLFSTFNPHVINEVDLYKSGFTARYGGRVSAVVDATGKRGNTEEIKAGVGLSLTSFNAYLESPLNKKVSVILGLRRSYQNFIKNNIYDRFLEDNRVDLTQTNSLRGGVDVDPDFNFFDMNAKLSANLGQQSNLDVNFYYSEDEFSSFFEKDEDDFFQSLTDEANWSNLGMSMFWERDWGQVSSTVGTSFSNFESNSTFLESFQFVGNFFADSLLFEPEIDTIGESYEIQQVNNIEEFSISWKNEIALNETNSLFLGTDLSSFNTKYGFNEGSENEVWFEDDETQASNQLATYLEYEANWKKLHLNIGVRYNYFEISDREDWEPRFNAKYYLTNDLSLNVSWSQHHQYITRIASNPFANSDTHSWVMADDETFFTMESTHWVSGLKFNKDQWSVDLEFYHKTISNVFVPEIFFFSNDEFSDTDFADFDDLDYTADGYSRGMDLFIKYKQDRLTSWVSYSLAESTNEHPFINEGEAFSNSFDQRHEINQVNLFKAGKWHFSTQFVFGSGRPYTPPASTEVNEFGDILYDLDLINSRRLPTYHRLDLSANYSVQFEHFAIESGITLFNIYDRQNIRSRRFTRTEVFDEEEEAFRLEVIPVDFRLLGITPNLTLNITF